MSKSLKIAWITAELTPFVKIGGLADVSSALPKALHNQDQEVKIVIPYYSTISDDLDIIPTNISYSDIDGKLCQLFMSKLPNTEIDVFLLKHPSFQGAAYDQTHDLGEKFTTFSWLVTRLFDFIRWYPDILHVNDWHTSVIPLLVKDIPVKTILTIHNLAFQGVESVGHLKRFGIDNVETNEDGKTNYMKLGINYSDQVTTVSETYAKEILTPEYGFGLEEVLRNHKREVMGIVHGIDLDEYDPSSDNLILTNYQINTLESKIENKRFLQKETSLNEDDSAFMIGLVSRLYEQKGINLLIDVLPALMDKNIQCVILGTGDPNYERELQRLEYTYQGKIKVLLMYNVQKSHEIFTGVDAFLVPSRFEPCGLTQMYSMSYGTVPIVRRTGGLADTVLESGDQDTQTGFLFDNFEGDDLKNAILRANDVFTNNHEFWKAIQKNGMQKDLSWDKPAKKWISLYSELID